MTLVELYVKRVRSHLMSINDVPPRWRQAVRDYIAELKARGE